MKTAIALLLAPFVSATSEYQTNYDVKTNALDIQYVFQISAQGSHTPSSALNWARDTAEEPTEFNSVTPLGIRQQYMIGDELRV